jgi:hypothetical protein
LNNGGWPKIPANVTVIVIAVKGIHGMDVGFDGNSLAKFTGDPGRVFDIASLL